MAIARYVSSAIMLLVASCFNSVDFTVSSFAPFSLMRSGPVPARRSICYNPLGCLPPVTVWQSISTGHFALTFSSICAILGSVLTIVASGLWVAENAIIEQFPVTAMYTNDWDYLWHNSSNSGDGGAISVFAQLEQSRIQMLNTIWKDMVLPGVQDLVMASDGYNTAHLS